MFVVNRTKLELHLLNIYHICVVVVGAGVIETSSKYVSMFLTENGGLGENHALISDLL